MSAAILKLRGVTFRLAYLGLLVSHFNRFKNVTVYESIFVHHFLRPAHDDNKCFLKLLIHGAAKSRSIEVKIRKAHKTWDLGRRCAGQIFSRQT